MIIYPAIDLRKGRCVRLVQGAADAETVFADDPLEAAVRWAAAGAEWLHVVNLDGALGESGAANLAMLGPISALRGCTGDQDSSSCRIASSSGGVMPDNASHKSALTPLATPFSINDGSPNCADSLRIASADIRVCVTCRSNGGGSSRSSISAGAVGANGGHRMEAT